MTLEIFNQSDFGKPVEFKANFKAPKKPKFEPGTFIITDIKQAVKNPNRVNIFVNGKYRFSLDIFQLGELGLKVGEIFSESQIEQFEQQSEFGKLYAQAVNYCMLRPHSEKEIRDYLWKKTLPRKLRNKKTGEFYEKSGVSVVSAEQVLDRLKQKRYIDDRNFARFWAENRNQRKGSSLKKIKSELLKKGVKLDDIEQALAESGRSDQQEIQKIIAKKSKKYSDRQKLMAYLARQGFSFDEIRRALDSTGDFEE